jgi:hypothetical protein
MIEQHEPHWKRWWTQVLRKGDIYTAISQLHQNMEYDTIWYDIPDIVVPITISLEVGCC